MASGADERVSVAIAVDAMALASRVDCVVLASASAALSPLVRGLRSQGLRVESASFDPDSPSSGPQHFQIGKECLFVP